MRSASRGRQVGPRVTVVRTLSRILVLTLVVLGLPLIAAADNTAPTAVKVAVAGDFSATSTAHDVWASMAATSPDLALALGDLSYGVTGQEQAWCDAVTARFGAGFPFELIAGNHESNGQNGNINDFSACLPNQLPGLVGTYGRQYYVDVPKAAPLVRFVMVSPGLPFSDGIWSYAVGSPRYQWTSDAIDGARSRNIPWVVVGLHEPCLSMGKYSCDPGIDLTNLFASKRVDLVLNGHDHSYQRSKQLALGPSCVTLERNTYRPDCVADADGAFAAGGGTVFAGVGVGGVAPLHDVNVTDPEAGYFAAWSGANVDPTFGHLSLDVTTDRLAARFVRATGGTFSDAFTITRGGPNQAPTAVAGVTCAMLTCTFDATASADPDGSITAYSWAFGDGSTATGPVPTHSYAQPGTYLATLTVTDNLAATGTTTREVSVSGPVNLPPTAVANASCMDLSCTFDGTGSADPDGTDVAYSWAFGDGATGTGPIVPHAYAAAGTYIAVLTVTDNLAATATATTTVTVSTPPVTALAADDFNRTSSTTWGAAAVGGPWTTTTSGFSTNGAGLITLIPGRGPTASLEQVQVPGADVRFTLTVDKVPNGSGLYVSSLLRKNAGGSYRAKLRWLGTGVRVSLVRTSSTGAETVVVPETAAVTANPGQIVNVRAMASGSAPTALRVKVWLAGTAEPISWSITASDATAGLQANGSVGFYTYLSSGATTNPLVVSIDDLLVCAPSP
jgi:PKD repeat protein